MAANRQSNLTEEEHYDKKLLRFLQATTNNAVGTGDVVPIPTQRGYFPITFTYSAASGTAMFPSPLPLPVEIREEKWVVLYKCAPDKFNWNNVEGVILKDKESGTEVKLTIKDLCIAAGLTW